MRRRDALLALLAIAGCRSRSADPSPGVRAEEPAISPDGILSASTPVMVNRRFVDATNGTIVGEAKVTLPDRDAPALPVPGRPGVYRLHRFTFDARTRRRIDPSDPDVVLDRRAETLTATTASGATAWVAPFGGRLGAIRSPDHVVTEDLAIVGTTNGLVALDRRGGKEVWSTRSAAEQLVASGDLLLSMERSAGSGARAILVVARQISTGREVFRIEVPGDSTPGPVVEHGDRFLITSADARYARVFTRSGAVVFELREPVLGARRVGDGWLVATSGRIARLDGVGKTVWETKGLKDTLHSSAGFAPLPGGAWTAYGHSLFSDSGVEIVVFDETRGDERFRVHVKGLGVEHSEYYHSAYAEARGDRLVVVSQGSSGSFVEPLDPRTGESLGRWRWAL